ncbi:MAG: heme-binding domain-containing protein [Thermoanaerobaculia bacterium]
MKIVKVVLALVVVFVLIQFIRPVRSNPPVDQVKSHPAKLQVPAPVASILARSCNDCHSSLTHWPWYSRVAPVSWLVAHDVSEGRGELSFSEWGGYPDQKLAKKLDAICREVRSGDMPPATYLPMHRSARLSETDRTILCDWAKSEAAHLRK